LKLYSLCFVVDVDELVELVLNLIVSGDVVCCFVVEKVGLDSDMISVVVNSLVVRFVNIFVVVS
jgi:hypothetical protein